jgi:hypothetical protein
VVRRVKVKVKMTTTKEDSNNSKETTEAVTWCNNLKEDITGANFYRKISDQTYSFNPSRDAFNKRGSSWKFYRRIAEVWGEFLIILLGDNSLGREMQAQREATQSVFNLLDAYEEDGENRGLTSPGMSPSAASQRVRFHPTVTFNAKGGGKSREHVQTNNGADKATGSKAQANPEALHVQDLGNNIGRLHDRFGSTTSLSVES